MQKQKLNVNPQQLKQAQEMMTPGLPELDGAKHYFALVMHNGQPLLAIMDNGKWRVTNQQEMMSLMY